MTTLDTAPAAAVVCARARLSAAVESDDPCAVAEAQQAMAAALAESNAETRTSDRSIERASSATDISNRTASSALTIAAVPEVEVSKPAAKHGSPAANQQSQHQPRLVLASPSELRSTQTVSSPVASPGGLRVERSKEKPRRVDTFTETTAPEFPPPSDVDRHTPTEESLSTAAPPKPGQPKLVPLSPAQTALMTRILLTAKPFKQLSTPQITRLVGNCLVQSAEVGQLICTEGENFPYFVGILSGKVEVSRRDKGKIGQMGENKWFGHYVKSPVALATCTCLMETLIVRVSSRDYDFACLDQPRDDNDHLSSGSSSIESPIELNQLKFSEMIGEGSFARVFRACTASGQVHAVKCVSKAKITRCDAKKQLVNEVQLLAALSHPFVIHMNQVLQDKHCVYIITEFAPGGEFFDYITSRELLSENEAQFYVMNIAHALDHMHQHCVVYRDLKPENLVFGADGYLKICDLGFSKKINAMTFTLCGTPDYIAPEIIRSKGHGKPVDYWSLGILVYEMLCGSTPYAQAEEDTYKIYDLIMNSPLMFPAHTKLSSDVMAFIRALLVIDPKSRLGSVYGAVGLQRHVWLEGANWSGVLERQGRAPYIPACHSQPLCTTSFEAVLPGLIQGRCVDWTPSFEIE